MSHFMMKINLDSSSSSSKSFKNSCTLLSLFAFLVLLVYFVLFSVVTFWIVFLSSALSSPTDESTHLLYLSFKRYFHRWNRITQFQHMAHVSFWVFSVCRNDCCLHFYCYYFANEQLWLLVMLLKLIYNTNVESAWLSTDHPSEYCFHKER